MSDTTDTDDTKCGCWGIYPRRIFKFSGFSYVRRVKDNFGSKFLIQLISAYTGVKGAMFQFLILSALPLYRSLKLDGLRYQSAITVAMIPWSMKGVIGAISDGLPIAGLNKKPYLLIFSTLGCLSLLTMALIPTDFAQKFLFLFPILYFFCHLQISSTDLLCEGMYSKIMISKPHTKSDIVSFVWLCIMLGTLVASCVNGPIVDHWGVKTLFWICVPLSLQSIIPTVLGFLPEKRVAGGIFNRREVIPAERAIERIPVRDPVLWKEKKQKRNAYILGGLMSVCALGQAFMAAFAPYQYTFIYALSVSLFLPIMNFVCLNKVIARCNTYLFLTGALYVSIGGALDFWYTADASCVPDGPHFSYTYYNTYTQIMGTIASMIGIWLFQTVFSNWRIRKIFLVSTLLKILAAGFDIILVERLNHKIGISDSVMYMLGDAIIERVVEMLRFMPSMVLTSKLCPKDLESTVFAILAGFLNFGSAVARSIGVMLIQKLKIVTINPGCNFDNLAQLVAIAHCLLPLATIPLVFILIPDRRFEDPTEKFLNEFQEVDKDGDKKDKDEESEISDEKEDSEDGEEREEREGEGLLSRDSPSVKGSPRHSLFSIGLSIPPSPLPLERHGSHRRKSSMTVHSPCPSSDPVDKSPGARELDAQYIFGKRA